jgi:hypothetical protein
MSAPNDEEDDAAHIRKAAEDVASYGWHVVGVEPEANAPMWAFTIGLFQRFGHAEILIFGDDFSVMHGVLNTIGEIMRAGGSLVADAVSEDVFEGCAAHFKPVHRRWYGPTLGTAVRYYDSEDFPVLQCFWPDRSGHFPWSAGYDPDLRHLQPMLFHADPVLARAEILEALEQYSRLHPEGWPFDQAPNVAAITTVNVIERRAPILLVFLQVDKRGRAFARDRDGHSTQD